MKKQYKLFSKTAEKISALWFQICLALAMPFISSPIYCDKIGAAAEQAAKGWQQTIQGAIKWVLVIVIVGMGAIFIFGNPRKKEEQKEKIPDIIIGLILVIFGIPIAGILFGWFN